jgi:hypothetical protein
LIAVGAIERLGQLNTTVPGCAFQSRSRNEKAGASLGYCHTTSRFVDEDFAVERRPATAIQTAQS